MRKINEVEMASSIFELCTEVVPIFLYIIYEAQYRMECALRYGLYTTLP